jgi:hypothetical protein
MAKNTCRGADLGGSMPVTSFLLVAWHHPDIGLLSCGTHLFLEIAGFSRCIAARADFLMTLMAAAA